MEQALVSIIVPVYKTKEFLAPCMESILTQDYKPLEIILVDDGSPDECPALCDSYAEQYSFVRVIHQKNQGLGMARNTGIRNAEGKYICFVDSDDKLDGASCISLMAACAEKNHADITQGAFRRINPDETLSGVNHHHLHAGSYTSSADFRFKGFYYHGHLAYNWGKLYRREFLLEHELYCRAYPFTQDKAHNAACNAYQPVYAFLDESVYLYRVNESSVSFRYKKNLIPVWISIAEDYLSFCKKRKIKAHEDIMAFHIFFGSFFVVKQEILAGNGVRAARRALKHYGAHPVAARYMRELSKRRYIRNVHGGIWNIAIPAAATVFRIHAYGLYALGLACMERLHIDKKISRTRYERRQ